MKWLKVCVCVVRPSPAKESQPMFCQKSKVLLSTLPARFSHAYFFPLFASHGTMLLPASLFFLWPRDFFSSSGERKKLFTDITQSFFCFNSLFTRAESWAGIIRKKSGERVQVFLLPLASLRALFFLAVYLDDRARRGNYPCSIT